MKTISYQKATKDDVELLVKYRTLFSTELLGPQSQDAELELQSNLRIYFEKAIADDTCIGFFARCGNDIAGVGQIIIRLQPGNFKNPGGKVGYLMNMYTVPEYRNNGICAGLINKLIDEARMYGVNAFELHATKMGEGVYKKAGFEIHPEPTFRKYIK